MRDVLSFDGVSLLAAYRNRSLSPREVVEWVSGRIGQLDPSVNAFALVDAEGALAAARASEERWMKGTPMGLADGLPVTIKDAIAWAGHPNRSGSRASDPAPVKESGPSVERLLAAGAIPLGKTTLPEFGWKGVSDSPLYGQTRNPWDTRLTSGGSSAGAGVAAALNLGVMHLAMDSAGSIRIPGAFCGVFGLKPSHGRIPSVPPTPFALVLDVGPMARTVRDAALLLTVTAGADPRDIWANQMPAQDYRVGLEDGVRGLRLAWSPRLGYVKALDRDVEELSARAARVFEELGATVEEADPGFEDPIEIIRTLWRTGSWSELRAVPEERWSEMDPGFVETAAAGRDISAADFFASVNRRTAVFATMAQFHARYDLLLTPSVATVPFEVGRDTPADGRFGDDWMSWAPYSYPFDLTLQPAATVPCGVTASGLPVGLQIVGPLLRDDLVLRAARAFEGIRPWPAVTEPRVRG
ncbi:amidase [Sorangium sp. So ce1036]|uniref:amidase n=1 Tax=Sorangium sp. So ce1036 TaxID=3133328 RepID=UPI003F087D8B